MWFDVAVVRGIYNVAIILVAEETERWGREKMTERGMGWGGGILCDDRFPQKYFASGLCMAHLYHLV